ncbi:A/G-specific adenine glycosylase [Oscillatoria sp. FACHB-1406]|uniref:A/G-specific adenine glycosylase n=1 Tax=Oscillatoria sp. FACHB-1406 TaxID=2692846 RepID=UPI00321FBC22
MRHKRIEPPVPEEIAQLQKSLRSWYKAQGRSLPWREDQDSYKIWISEIMLQQTQVKTVIPYYQRWLDKFPTLPDLAAADLQTVLKAWEGLGYYARGRNLHKAARQIIAQHNGEIPRNLETLLTLPGIGRTTAGGILSAAFNLPVSILDGNVKRVLARLVALDVPPAKAISDLWNLSDVLLDTKHPRDFNQALMDLGATLCTPKKPACLLCPWQTHCQAYNKGIQAQIPMKEQSAPLPHKQIGVAVIQNPQGQILIDRRPENGLLGGLWEFPGGKIEAGETIPDCIKREIKEELGIDIEVGEHLMSLEHAYTHFRVTLHVHYCCHIGGEPQAIECQEIRWVTLEEIDEFPFPKANSQIIAALRENELKKRKL